MKPLGESVGALLGNEGIMDIEMILDSDAEQSANVKFIIYL